MVASAVGGIQDQIEDGAAGCSCDDPTDLDAFAERRGQAAAPSEPAPGSGAGARERVRDRFLGDRHLIQYVELFEAMLAGE